MPSTHVAKLELSVVPPSQAAEYQRQRVDRLRELRAVIDALRHEKEARDPLLAWVVQDNLSGTPRAD